MHEVNACVGLKFQRYNHIIYSSTKRSIYIFLSLEYELQ